MCLDKKGLHPVIGGVLLLIFAVMSVVSFQGWFASYSTQIFNHVENQRDIGSFVRVEGVAGDSLYLKSDSDTTLNNLKIVNNSGSIMCEIGDSSESTAKGVTKLLFDFEKNNLNSTHVKDLSGYDNDGVLNGGVNCSVDGVSGRGCEFDGIDDWINVSDGTSLNFSGEMTSSVWMLINDNHIYNKSNILETNLHVVRYYVNTNEILTYFANGTDTYNFNWQNIKFDSNLKGTYHNIISVYDNNYMKLYIDGALKEKKGFYPRATQDNNPFRIGNHYIEGYFLNGTIDEVVIYSKALSDSEVETLYEAGEAKLYEQIVSESVKEINISSCNLTSGEEYSFVGVGEDGVYEEYFVKR